MAINCQEREQIIDVISSIYVTYENDIRYSSVLFDIPLSYSIIEKATIILEQEQAVLQIDTRKSNSDFIIVGDIHGSLESLIRIFKEKGYPNTTRYLFLGDYVDRGSNSCEVIILLYSLKCLYPNNIYLIRGNHEFSNINEHYGFKDECYKRIKTSIKGKEISEGQTFYQKITNSFEHLPICAILNDSIFCVHGGITSLINDREELFNLKKVGSQFQPFDSIQAEFLWNDPCNSILTYSESGRGFGCIFGQKALQNFLQKMNFELVIRGHQSEADGYKWPFGQFGGILTVFSSINYCGIDNNASVAVISNDEFVDVDDLVEVYQLEKKSKNKNLFVILLQIILITCLVSIFT